VEDLAVGGWQLTGITTFQTGFPYSILGNDIQGANDSQAMHGNIVPGCNIKSNLTAKFQRINTACFAQPPLGTYGTIGRNTLRSPGINNFDLGLGKQFAFTERLRFQIKADAFNAFNHHQYTDDVGGLLVAGSGGNSVIDNNVNDSKFGLITRSSKSREYQFSGKVTF
jgi:hypothetical protein